MQLSIELSSDARPRTCPAVWARSVLSLGVFSSRRGPLPLSVTAFHSPQQVEVNFLRAVRTPVPGTPRNEESQGLARAAGFVFLVHEFRGQAEHYAQQFRLHVRGAEQGVCSLPRYRLCFAGLLRSELLQPCWHLATAFGLQLPQSDPTSGNPTSHTVDAREFSCVLNF